MTDSSQPVPAPTGPTPPGPVPGWQGVAARPQRAPLLGVVAAPVARRVVVAAAAFGLMFQYLVVGQVVGINVLVWTATLMTMAALAGRRGRRMARSDAWLPIAAIVFAGLAAVRAAPQVQAFDTLAALALGAAAMAAFAGAPVTGRSVTGIARLGWQGLEVAFLGVGRLAPAAEGVRAAAPGSASRVRRVGVGLALAAIPVSVFALLFAQADAVFGSMLGDALTWRLDTGEVLMRLMVGVMAGWLVAGALVLVVAATRTVRRERSVALPRLGWLEATIVLVAVDAMFAWFVAIQAGYLFGGMDTVGATGLGYAEYARRGFFELVTVAFLVGGLLIVLESVTRERPALYRAAGLVLVVLTGVVLASAAVRMALYQDAFGWTELRFYVAAAIGWLVLCLVAAAVAIATDRSRWLPHASLVLALVVAVGVNLADPQAFVAGQNVHRALYPAEVPAGGSTGLDSDYLGTLGPDAAPVLVEALPLLPDLERQAVTRALLMLRAEQRVLAARTGWPSWDLARARAMEALETLR